MSMLILYILLGVLLVVIIRRKPKPTIMGDITCPRCKTVATFKPGQCNNCGSADTLVRRGGRSRLVQFCRKCRATPFVPTYCTNCWTDLSGLMGVPSCEPTSPEYRAIAWKKYGGN